MKELDWKKREITKLEALDLLVEAHEIMDYVDKMLPTTERPHYLWGNFLRGAVKAIEDLAFWMRG